MGGYYTNITLHHGDRGAVAAWLREAGRDAFVSTVQRDAVVVFDEVNDATCGLELDELAARLSEALACAALAVRNADDSAFAYDLYVAGRSIDHYEALPEAIAGGDADLLCRAFGSAADRGEVNAILRRHFTVQTSRHEALVAALGLPAAAVGLGYEYLDRDSEAARDAAGDFLRITPERRTEPPPEDVSERAEAPLPWRQGDAVPAFAGITVGASRDTVIAALGKPPRTASLGPEIDILSYRARGLEVLIAERSGVNAVMVFKPDGPDLYGVHVGDSWPSVRARWGEPSERARSAAVDVLYFYHLGTAWTIHVELDKREERVLRLSLGSSLLGRALT